MQRTGGWGTTRTVGVNTCGHPDRRHYAKGLCRRCYATSPHMKAKRRAYYDANREKWTEWQRSTNERRVPQARRYGISSEALEAMHAQQGGRCAICAESKGLHVDHCHKTGAVRAFLCRACNFAIGFLKDSPDLCNKAAEYLRNHEQTNREQPCHATPAA